MLQSVPKTRRTYAKLSLPTRVAIAKHLEHLLVCLDSGDGTPATAQWIYLPGKDMSDEKVAAELNASKAFSEHITGSGVQGVRVTMFGNSRTKAPPPPPMPEPPQAPSAFLPDRLERTEEALASAQRYVELLQNDTNGHLQRILERLARLEKLQGIDIYGNPLLGAEL